ncbi:MAG TPA: MoxR family ATPase, partial [Acidobacteriaceae bacterium]|nr:MoxR family ATPase [Acidobacteriaceae bacterium]
MVSIASFDRDAMRLQQRIERFHAVREGILEQVREVIVAQDEVLDQVLIGIFVGGHCLMTGLPGTAKTLMVRTLAEALGLEFRRIQFTPDLMPSDITGTDIIEEDISTGHRKWSFVEGPIFANILLADEINRTPPKTQSALLEAMQEHRVSVGRRTHVLEEPFVVLATQNPLESEGTYPLPEAQLDRFFMKLHVPFPNRDELHAILDRTTGEAVTKAEAVLHREDIIQMQALVRRVPVARHVQDYAIRVIQATHPDGPDAPAVCKQFVRFGASPRGAQSVLLAAKIRALFDGRFAASIDDVRAVVHPALRHRMLLNFEGEAEGIKTDQLIDAIVKSVA